ncbi:NfeD family protein [Demequina sp.]|uniref:NfeD family protein n=1 Tax=Demequina sp. TaxID=2050685 RepID=UPI0025D8BDEE|nr:NfeD family protein [Demequina sp.]
MQFLGWFIGAMVLGIAEVFTLDLTFAMLAAGALAGGVAALLGAPWWLAVIVFCAVSATMLLGLRPFLLRRMRAHGPLIETNTAALVGRSARSLDEVTETAGRVKLNGEVWTARTEDDAPPIREGIDVTVVRIKGATAIVAPEEE